MSTAAERLCRVGRVCSCGAVLLVLAVAAFCASAPAVAEEQPEEFVEALRQRGYFDTADEYLAWARTSPLVGEDFKSSIPYEQALTLVRQADVASAAAQKEQLLRAAIDKLQQFADKEPTHKLVNRVKTEIGRIKSSLGELKLRLADRSGADKETLRLEARELFDSAYALGKEAEQPLRAQLNDRSRFPVLIAPSQTKLLKDQNDLLRDLIGAESLMCSVAYELSKTYEPGSSEFKDQLAKAAAAYEKLFQEYRGQRLYVGIQARFLQGRCLKEKGDSQKAMECFSAFLDLNEQQLRDPRLKQLRAQSSVYALEIWIGEKKYDEAIQAAGVKLSPEEARQGVWLAVRFLTAKAWKLKADSLQGNKRERDAAISQAGSLAGLVAATPGEYQMQARKLLDEMGLAETAKAPQTFADARDRAVLAHQKWKIVEQVYNSSSAEKQQQLRGDLAEQRRAAFDAYKEALSLAGPDVPASELNAIYYALSYFYLADENYPAAAVLGEHVARNYPDAREAKDAAQYALRAWQLQYNENRTAAEPCTFERDRMLSMARFMVEHWPDAEQTVSAELKLLEFATQNGRTDEALQYLARIPQQSPYRGAAELQVGWGLWNVYLGEARKPEASRLGRQKLAELRDNVEKILSDGVKRSQESGRVDYTVAVAVLYLAQLYVDTNRPQEALRLLEDPKIGPLTLVAAGDPNTGKEAFRIEAYKVALRSYIGVMPKYKNDKPQREALMKKAEAIMDAAEKAVGSDSQASEKLTQIYLAMGKDLEGQLQSVRDDLQAREALSAAIEEFLSRITLRPGNNFGALAWVGETFFKLGAAADTGQRPISPAAQRYFTKAAAMYEQILRNAGAKPGFLPKQRTEWVEMRLAVSYRRMAAYGQALDVLETVLKAHHNSLAAQIEAAEVLELRGDAENPQFYEKAILGDRPDANGRNVFWGWALMAQQVAKQLDKNRAFESYYFQANFKSTECRYLLGTKLTGEQQIVKFEAAKKLMLMTWQRYPDLGGPERKAEYDALLRKVQQALKEPVVGLKAFEHKTPAAGH